MRRLPEHCARGGFFLGRVRALTHHAVEFTRAQTPCARIDCPFGREQERVAVREKI
jgi:hypothetical protein